MAILQGASEYLTHLYSTDLQGHIPVGMHPAPDDKADLQFVLNSTGVVEPSTDFKELLSPYWGTIRDRAARTNNFMTGRGKPQAHMARSNPSEWVFNRIHFIPYEVDFGVIIGRAEYPIDVWCPFERAVTLESIDKTDLDTVTFDWSIVPPEDLAAMSNYSANVIAASEGANEIGGEFTFTTTGYGVYNLPVKGRRSLVYGFNHNWAEEFAENFEWRTSILSSDDTSEARRPVRVYPRVSYSSQHLIQPRAFQWAKHYLAAWHSKPFTYPLWHKQLRLDKVVEAGATIVELDTDWLDIKVGMNILFLLDYDDYELKQVEAVTDTTVQFTAPLTSTWRVGTKVFPVIGAVPRAALAVDGVTDNIAKVTQSLFEVDFSEEHLAVPNPTGYVETYKDEPLLPLQHSFDENRPDSYAKDKVTKVDYQAGAPIFFDNAEIVTRKTVLNLKALSRLQVFALREFLFQVEGKHKAFWAPTYDQDFTLAPIQQAAGAGSILVMDNDYGNLIGLRPDMKNIYIELWNGTKMYFEIRQWAINNDGYMVFTLDGALPEAFGRDDIKHFSYLYRWRLEVDRVTVSYVTPEIAKCNLAVRSLGADDELSE